MTETVYPKLLEVMAHNAMDYVTIDLKGANLILINNKSEMSWKKEGNLPDTWKKIEAGHDPAFRQYENTQKLYASPNDMYVEHCNLVMNKIDEVSKLTHRVDEAIQRAEQIGVVYERKVLIEKIIKN